MGSITIPGWASNDRIPRVVFALAFGQGPHGSGVAQDYVLFAGARAYDATAPTPVAQGTATDAEPVAVYSADDAATKWGYGSEIHRMAIRWFRAYPSSPAYGVSPAKGEAAARATKDCVLASPPTVSGTATIEIAGTSVQVYIEAAAAIADIGADMAAAINADTSLPVLASFVTATLTLTAKCYGPNGNQIKYRIYDLPASLTCTNSDSTLATGAVEPSWSAAYAAAFALDTVFYHIMPATNTVATLNAGTGNLRGRIKDNLAPTVGKLMDVFVGATTTLAAAETINDGLDLGTTDYDEPGYWFRLAWAKTNYLEPWVYAARVGGECAAAEGTSPVQNWIGLEGGPVFDDVAPTPLVSNYPTDTELNEAIAYGISPAQYSHKQQVTRLVTMVTSKHLIGVANDPSYVEHTNITAVCRAVSYGMRASLAADFSGFNVMDDAAGGTTPDKLPSRTTCPAHVKQTLLTHMRQDYESRGWVQKVTTHAAATTVERDPSLPGRLLYELPIDAIRWVDAIGGFHREVGR